MKFSSSPRVVSDDSLKRMMYRNIPDRLPMYSRLSCFLSPRTSDERLLSALKRSGAYLVRNGVVLAAEIFDPEHLDFLFMPVLLIDHQHDAADQQAYRIGDDQIPDFVVAQREPRFFGLQRDDQHGREDDSRDDECAHQAPHQEGEPPAQEYFQQQDGRQPQDAEPDDRYGRPFRPPGDCYQRIPVLAQLDQESRHRDGPP